MQEWCHQDCDRGHSQLCSPSQEQLITIHGKDSTEKILEHRGRAKAPPCTTENKKDCARNVRGTATCWWHCLSPRPVQHHAERSPLSLRFFWWKTKARVHIQLLLAAPLLIFPQRDCRGTIGLDHGESDCDGGEERRLQQPALGYWLIDWVPTCNAQVVAPNSTFAHR